MESQFQPLKDTNLEANCWMSQMSTEIMLQIFSLVDTVSLTKCRLVSRIWNHIGTDALRNNHKPIEIKSNRELSYFNWLMRSTLSVCPFTRFKINLDFCHNNEKSVTTFLELVSNDAQEYHFHCAEKKNDCCLELNRNLLTKFLMNTSKLQCLTFEDLRPSAIPTLKTLESYCKVPWTQLETLHFKNKRFVPGVILLKFIIGKSSLLQTLILDIHISIYPDPILLPEICNILPPQTKIKLLRLCRIGLATGNIFSLDVFPNLARSKSHRFTELNLDFARSWSIAGYRAYPLFWLWLMEQPLRKLIFTDYCDNSIQLMSGSLPCTELDLTWHCVSVQEIPKNRHLLFLNVKKLTLTLDCDNELAVFATKLPHLNHLEIIMPERDSGGGFTPFESRIWRTITGEEQTKTELEIKNTRSVGLGHDDECKSPFHAMKCLQILELQLQRHGKSDMLLLPLVYLCKRNEIHKLHSLFINIFHTEDKRNLKAWMLEVFFLHHQKVICRDRRSQK